MNQIRIINADVLDGLAQLEDESVNCVVTSPPYWGLRDYGTAVWMAGSDKCDHTPPRRARTDRPRVGLTGGTATIDAAEAVYKAVCLKCGAVRIDKQIGLEDTPEAFASRLCDVFREVRRVLRSDGTLWLNLGDSYAMSTKGSSGKGDKQRRNAGTLLDDRSQSIPAGLKPKDLVGIPWRVAFALQADGWYLRQDIIWHKPNPMPESVTDRCTKAHEYIFLLTKSAKYAYNNDAVREASLPDRKCGKGSTVRAKGHLPGNKQNGRGVGFVQPEKWNNPAGRNKRSVWTMATQPNKAAHFATFPEQLAELCIKAGCPEGGTVLDPFGGAGTTGLVAAKLGRDAILIELNPEYAKIAEERIAGELPLLASVEREQA